MAARPVRRLAASQAIARAALGDPEVVPMYVDDARERLEDTAYLAACELVGVTSVSVAEDHPHYGVRNLAVVLVESEAVDLPHRAARSLWRRALRWCTLEAARLRTLLAPFPTDPLRRTP